MTILGFLWWSWSSYGWLANQSRVDGGILRAGMVFAMCAMFIIALAIPTAFVRIPGELNSAIVIAIAAERILRARRDRELAALANEAYTYIHLLLIAGIVISAVGVETVMEATATASTFGWFGTCALFGGTSLYLFAHAVFWRRVGGYWKPGRLSLLPCFCFLSRSGQSCRHSAHSG